MANVHTGKSSSMLSCQSPEEIAQLKYCPLTSVNVECSFSTYKHILNDKRQSFKGSNLEKVAVSISMPGSYKKM